MKHGAIFIDRDGVLNHMVQYEGNWDSPQKPGDISLLDGVSDVISSVNKKGVMVVEISNQPGVAKGKMTQETSDAIEHKVHELLKDGGAKIDHIYICPHHPRGTVPELTTDCDCRKPKPGLIFQAAKEHNIDLSKSVFLGDKASDAEAGKAAGVTTIIYLHEEDLPEKVEGAKNTDADYKADSMEQVGKIISRLF